MYYTNEAKVLSYDCDLRNRMKMSAAMRYMQQVAGEQLVVLGFPAEVLNEQDKVFLMTKICIKVHRIPTLHEEIIIGTAPTHTKGVRFVREFVIDSKEGERLVSAVSYWPLIQPSSRKVLRPADFGYDMDFQPELIDKYITDIPFPKGKIEGEFLYDEHIKYSEIDINKHVNNTEYADIICDAMSYELMSEEDIDTFVIGFQNEAIIDDVITVKRHDISDREYYVIGNHERAECFKGLVKFR